MAALTHDQELLERILCERARFYARPDKYRTLPVFDQTHSQYLLMDEGWDGFKRIHRVWLHVELKEGQFWIQEDGTQDGIATDLMAAGIPRDRIVLAFQHPGRRDANEFAMA
jgi:hypothetical protein